MFCCCWKRNSVRRGVPIHNINDNKDDANIPFAVANVLVDVTDDEVVPKLKILNKCYILLVWLSVLPNQHHMIKVQESIS